MDWGDGEYERTAALLAPASDLVVEVAGIRPGERVLDVATGTGNCALAAAALGARVTGVDPARRLLAVAAGRPGGSGVEWLQGEGSALPVPDASFDVVTSVFGVIFVPDAPAALAQLVSKAAPDGRVVLATWTAEGVLATVGALLREAVVSTVGQAPGPAPSDWTDVVLVRRLLEELGAHVTVHEASLVFTAESADAWFAQQEGYHPVWRGGRAATSEVVWADVRARSVALLEAAHEPGDGTHGLRVRSGYRVVRADL